MRRSVGVGEALGTAELGPLTVVFYTFLSLHSSRQIWGTLGNTFKVDGWQSQASVRMAVFHQRFVDPG